MGSGSSRGERSERGEPLGPGGMTPQQLYYLQHSLYGGAPLGERGFLPQAGLTPEQLSMIASQGGALGDVFFPFPPEQPRPPPPEMTDSYVVRNDVNLNKNSMKLVQTSEGSSKYYVEFTFDASRPCAISVFFGVREFAQPDHSSKLEPLRAFRSTRTVHPAGSHQRYSQVDRPDEYLDVAQYSAADLTYREGDNTFGVLVLLEALPGDDAAAGASWAGPAPLVLPVKRPDGTPAQSQTTYASVVGAGAAAASATSSGGAAASCSLRVIKQRVLVAGRIYEVNELYGGGSGGGRSTSASAGGGGGAGGAADAGAAAAGEDDDDDGGGECVVCLTEPRDTTVLPCRHLCLCRGCADKLRMQSNHCPICRAPVRQLLHMDLSKEGAHAGSAAAGAESGGAAGHG